MFDTKYFYKVGKHPKCKKCIYCDCTYGKCCKDPVKIDRAGQDPACVNFIGKSDEDKDGND